MKHWRLVIFFILLILIGIFSYYPLKYRFADKTSLRLPDYISYDSAMTRILPAKIQKTLTEKGLKTKSTVYVLPVKQIENFDNSIPHLKEDVNLALASYPHWKLLVDEQTERELKQYYDTKAKRYGELLPGSEISRRLKREARLFIKETKYSTRAKWIFPDGDKVNNARVIIQIIDNETHSVLSEIPVSFAHPRTVEKWKAVVQEENNRLNTLKRHAEVSRTFLNVLLLLMGVYLLTLLSIWTGKKINYARERSFILHEIQKREELVTNGHFVAALELADKYLQYFPDDFEIRAFRERLLDFTNNDPKQAQIAFVEAKKLRGKLETFQPGKQTALLDGEEKNAVAALLPYNPDLKALYEQALSLEEQAKKEQEFESRLGELHQLLEEKKIHQCQLKLQQFKRIYPDYSDLSDIEREIETAEQKARERFRQVQQYLTSAEVRSALSLLAEILADYKDFEDALHLQQEIEACKESQKFVLHPRNREKEILLFCKDEIILGREDEDVQPDVVIADRRVSRRHLRLDILEDHVVAEDLQSTGGTFVNGEKITSRKLTDGDILNMAKLFEYTVSIYRLEDGTVGGVALEGARQIIFVVPTLFRFQLKNGKIQTGNGSYAFCYREGVPLFIADQGYSFLKNDENLVIGKINYNIEVFI